RNIESFGNLPVNEDYYLIEEDEDEDEHDSEDEAQPSIDNSIEPSAVVESDSESDASDVELERSDYDELQRSQEDQFSTRPSFPYTNELYLEAITFFKSTSIRYSEDDIKRILEYGKSCLNHGVKLRDKMHEEASINSQGQSPSSLCAAISAKPLNVKFPTVNGVVHYQNTQKDVPQTPVTEHRIRVVKGTGVNQRTVDESLFVLPIFEHLRLSTSNPVMSYSLSALPDETPNQRANLCQGEKWTKHPDFPWPMLVVKPNGLPRSQLWISDIAFIPADNGVLQDYKIARFKTVNANIKVECYPLITQLGDMGSGRRYMSKKKSTFALHYGERIGV
ncbi:hypothetical protein CU098_003800, partial [Rhizopus stolonifer]